MFGFVLSILTQRRAESQEETLEWQPTDTARYGTALTT